MFNDYISQMRVLKIGLKELTLGAAGFLLIKSLIKNVVTRVKLRKFLQISNSYRFGFRYFLGCHRIPKKLEDMWLVENARFDEMRNLINDKNLDGIKKFKNQEVLKGILVTWMTPFHYMITLNTPEAVEKLYSSNNLDHLEKNYFVK